MYRLVASFLFALVISIPATFAQIGLNVHSNWWTGHNAERVQWHGAEQSVGLSYWFRLQKRRLEFHPELYVSHSTNSGAGSPTPIEGEEGIHLGMRIPAQAYLMDWDSDCMCPTFSKQGLWLKKGFFTWAAPGMQFLPHLPSLTLEGGVGLDIGVGNIITLAPQIGYRYSTRQQGLDNSASHLVTQLRIFFRWDKENFFR